MPPRNLVLNYTIKFSSDGWKQLNKLDGKVARKVMGKVEMLCNFRSLNTIKKMEGNIRCNYRLRIGNVRVIFDVDEVNKIVWIVDVGFRGEVYCR